MSLILDALRKADAQRERERGAVPGLHAQPMAVPSSVAAEPGGRRPALWIALVAGVLAAAAVAWLVAGRQAGPPAAPVAQTTPAAEPATAPPKAAESVTAAAAAATAAPAAPAAAPPQPVTATAPLPVAEPAPWPSAERSRLPVAEAAAPPAAATAKTAVAASAAPPEPPIMSRQQLPEAIRAQLPPLAVGGSIYSANPADRSVIIDGRIYRENDRLGADLTLEQIGAKSAVLRYKGYRFEIGF